MYSSMCHKFCISPFISFVIMVVMAVVAVAAVAVISGNMTYYQRCGYHTYYDILSPDLVNIVSFVRYDDEFI